MCLTACPTLLVRLTGAQILNHWPQRSGACWPGFDQYFQVSDFGGGRLELWIHPSAIWMLSLRAQPRISSHACSTAAAQGVRAARAPKRYPRPGSEKYNWRPGMRLPRPARECCTCSAIRLARGYELTSTVLAHEQPRQDGMQSIKRSSKNAKERASFGARSRRYAPTCRG
jgi:hypothetical protein